MKLVQLFIPLYDNGGNRFDDGHFEMLREEFTVKFGGVTLYKRTTGFWKEGEQPTQKDDILIYEVMVKRIEKKYWKDLKETLLIRFRQKEIVSRYSEIGLL
jgi:hypothetical protein